jgi:hypothetical protein
MRRGAFPKTLFAGLLLSASSLALAAGPASKTLTLWPGYTIELPAGYCVDLSRRADFDLVYFRDPSRKPVLVGIYAGHNPENLECKQPVTKKQWTANGLSLESVRNAECTELLIQDPKKPDRGFLHIWFGPDGQEHRDRAEGVISSIRPSSLPVYRPDDLPKCPAEK